MHDRLKRGAIAGLVALPFVIAVNLTSYHLLRFAKARWVDAITHLVYGRAATNPIELALGFFAFFVSAGGLGALYVLLVVPEPGRGDYLFRGVGWGLGTWFISYMVGGIFEVPSLHRIAWQTAITQVAGVIGWGLIIGWLTKRWDETYEDKAAVRPTPTVNAAPGLESAAAQLRGASQLLVQSADRLSAALGRLDEGVAGERPAPRRVVRRRRAATSDTREQIEAKWGSAEREDD